MTKHFILFLLRHKVNYKKLFSNKVSLHICHVTHNGTIQYPCIMLCHSDIGMSQNLRDIFH